MRFMVIVKATADSEAGVLPSEATLAEMGKFNEELVRSGMLLAGDGLKPSSAGARIQYAGAKRTVIDGPFAETKELVAGYWILQASSRDELIEWMKRAPFREGEIEIRPLFEAEDFAPSDPTGEHRQKEAALREEARKRT